jgi:O-methyltransferase
MASTMKTILKRAIPPRLLNNALLAFPSLYRTRLVNYETNMATPGLDDLLSQLECALELPGDIIECGSSRCGASVIMANYCRTRGIEKTIYACDSFQGFDPEELRKERDAGLTATPERAFTSTSYDYVRKKITRLRVDNVVRPIKGYFSMTLPHIHSTFCLALVDCDLADSILYCAETIWPKLVSKGRILFDDYLEDEFRGARIGVDQFIKKYSSEIEHHGLGKQLYVVTKL